MKSHFLAAGTTHDRWNRELPPVLEIQSGDDVEMEMLDSSGGQVQHDWTAKDFPRLDRNRIHTLTGPIFVKDAQAGDVLQIDILSITHQGWGWTSLIPGLGLLPERFPDADLFIWKLEVDVSRSMSPAIVPLRPFCGIMGVAPEEFGEQRTRPPGVFGGNLDVRQLGAGSTLYLPVQVPGALFSAGDAHAAQGDGEVCINGIEMPSKGHFRFTVRRDLTLREPFAETAGGSMESGAEAAWIFIASRVGPLDAAKSVVNQAIDFIANRTGLSPTRAYMLCSVALDLRISQWVNQPMVTITGHLRKSILGGA